MELSSNSSGCMEAGDADFGVLCAYYLGETWPS